MFDCSGAGPNLTMVEGYALDMFLAMFGRDPGFRLDVAREIREAVEGKATQRVEVAESQQQTQEDMQRELWAWAYESEYKRCKLFGMPIPEDTARMARQVEMELARREPSSEANPDTA